MVFGFFYNSKFIIFFCFVSIHYDDDDGGDYFRSIQLPIITILFPLDSLKKRNEKKTGNQSTGPGDGDV